MIQNLVALGDCLKSGSNRGTGTDGTALSSPEGVLEVIQWWRGYSDRGIQ
jgi:hypothetical protein